MGGSADKNSERHSTTRRPLGRLGGTPWLSLLCRLGPDSSAHLRRRTTPESARILPWSRRFPPAVPIARDSPAQPRHQVQLKSWLLSGSERIRLPVILKMAL